ncbi:MAG: VCBS repeat-containing protein, partial [Planctomycetes bacterium]|nr:VCBS repeat-containing protein [Planctomycetota bacterium]
RHYQTVNAYDRMLDLWTARRQWSQALIGALNFASLRPADSGLQRTLLIAADAFWDGLSSARRRALLSAMLDGELCEVGHLAGVLVAVARARTLLRDDAGARPLIAPRGRDRFVDDLIARSPSAIGTLATCMQIERLDLEKLAVVAATEREALVSAWLAAAVEAAAAIVDRLDGWLPDGDVPFALSPSRPLPPSLVVERELPSPTLAPSAMWMQVVAVLRGPEPRAVITGAGDTVAERMRGVVELRGLDGELVATVRGADSAAGFGTAVADLGDVDGDGYEDAAIAAAPSDGRPVEVTVIGGRDGMVLHVLPATDAAEAFGQIAIGLDDPNGDGTTRLAISAPQGSIAGRTRCGVVRVIDLAGRIVREHAGRRSIDAYGRSLARLGDLDGDGVEDFAIGTECELPPLYAEVRSGRTGDLLFAVEAADFRVGSATVAACGDADGDGVPDLLVAFGTLVPWQPPGGRVELVSGRSGATLRTFTAGAPRDGFGTDVTVLGDLDGDGMAEFVVAASCEVAATPPTAFVWSLDGAGPTRLPGVFRLLPAGGDRLVALTIATWGRYAAAPMASGARLRVARWR